MANTKEALTPRELRERKKLTLREVGRRLGTSHSYIHNLEESLNPGLVTLQKYATAIETPLPLVVAGFVKLSEKSLQNP